MGALLQDGSAFRLFPDANILFVGTMNEDESTQSLSDKVIDRASVLRFWRPKNTRPDLAQHPLDRPDRGLAYDAWRGWVRDGRDLESHSQQVEDWIGALNDSLTKLGRPFAYRVANAMRAYVANYPRWTHDWSKKAMADQIEQRLFPKLRGVEPEQELDALLGIERVITELDDELLRSAFRESYDGQPTFLFRGVTRDEG